MGKFKKLLFSIMALGFATISHSVLGQATLTQNYVMTNTVKQSGVTTEAGVNALAIATQGKSQTINYFDGLGRPLQTVVTQGSASQKDIVTGVEYDAFGREVKKYLPYADQTSTVYGSFKDRWNNNQASFYNGIMPNVDADNSPFSLAVMEPSPMNRIQAQGAAGAVWQPNAANAYDPSSNVAQFQYMVNSAVDNVRLFNIDSAGNITSSGYYPNGQLTVKISTDENLQTIKEFTDEDGLVVLKRVMISGDSLQTYYIYDNLNMLRAVIQPEGTAALQAASWVFATGFSGKWMFLYRYDTRQRMVMKKVPGADSVSMIYDQWDRVVLTQDGNLRAAHNYLFNKYDPLDRVAVTGQITDARALSAVIADVAAATGRFETVSTSAPEGYTLSGSFPSSGTYTLTVYTTDHYDSYNNLPSWSSGYSFVSEFSVAPQNAFLNGQLVATQKRVLGTSTFNRDVNCFDDKYRLIQSTVDNGAGGKDRTTKILSFDGKITNDYNSHTSRFFTTALLTKQAYTYDHFDRLLTVTHQTASQEVVTITQNAYNEVGQLLNKKIHQSNSHPNALQKLDYYYNIRGWLTGINRPIIVEPGYDESDLFTLELHYSTVTMPQATPQYNGNIAEQIWKNGYDEGEQGYNYQYDQANRLTNSSYGFPWYNGTQTWVFTKRFNESSIAYDRNGNIQKLSRYFGDWNLIDSLGYKNYTGNQLGKVDDAAGPNLPVGFQDKDNGSGSDYTYDVNGNLTKDYNKSITSTTYNYLNLPMVITIAGKGTITFTYDADGNKLQKTTLDQTVTPNKTINYYYAGDYVYRNDTLEFISHPEGRLRPIRIDTTQAISITNLKYIYDYFLKDHLGNIRSVLTTEQQTDIYAATMESTAATKEDALFSNVSATGTGTPAGMTNDIHNLRVSKLNGAINLGSNKRVGPSIVLKVMIGDTISISALSWYTGPVQPPATGVSDIATDLLPLLLNGVAGQNGSKGGAVPTAFSDPALGTSLTNFLSSGRPYVNTRPKAFLNWMVMGEDYTAATNSPNHVSAMQIPTCNAGDTLKQVVGLTNMVVRRNGWIYIYLSNESAQDVYFDNLVVNLKHGPLVEQKDYYPFGLENPALSTQALKYQYNQNRYRYNGIEYDSTFGLDVDEAHFRDLDPQIGRWTTIDPKIEDGQESMSPYTSMYNDPCRISDPLGDEGGIGDAIMTGVRWINSNLNPLTPVVELITGKSVESDLTQEKPRSTSATEAVLFALPELKMEALAAKTLDKAALVAINRQVGKAAEKTVVKEAIQQGEKDVSEQISIKAKNGVKTTMDVASRDGEGAVKLREVKGSQKAPLSRNQKSAHPSIEKNGGVVVGKGKPGFPGGTKIPPTKVEVVRPIPTITPL